MNSVSISTTMDQVVKRAKDSFGQMFDKSLHDLVRGIRNHKDNEVWFAKSKKKTIFLFEKLNIYFLG